MSLVYRILASAAVLLACLAGCAATASASAGGGWRAQASGTSQPLYDVSCLSASHCLAVGADDTILATVNGGRHWYREHGLAGGAPLWRVTCVAPSTCYVIDRPSTIWVSHNGGTSWKAARLPITVSGLTATGYCPQAETSNPATVPSKLMSCPLGLTSISCVTAEVCYASATGPNGYSIAINTSKTPPDSIWATSNGGRTWTAQAVPAGVACPGDDCTGLFDYPLKWVSCVAGGDCWAGGEVFDGSHNGAAAAVLTNASGSWRQLGGSHAFAPAADIASCPSDNLCYGELNSDPVSGGLTAWRSEGAAPSLTYPDQFAPYPPVIYDITCATTRDCVTADAGGAILATTNGKNFGYVHSPTRHDLYAVTCATTSACFAVGTDGTIVAGPA
jgi:hypothetical protein